MKKEYGTSVIEQSIALWKEMDYLVALTTAEPFTRERIIYLMMQQTDGTL